MGKAGMTYYNIECPANDAVIGTGQTVNTDGIPLGKNSNAFSALYYVIPMGTSGPTSYSSVALNFRVVPYLSIVENLAPHWVLLAMLNNDANQALVKWQAGGVVLPLPADGQQI